MASNNSRNSNAQKRLAFRKNLHILKNLVNSKSEDNCTIIKDAFFYICALTLKLEALKREKMNKINLDDKLPLLKVNVKKDKESEIELSITIERAKDNYLGDILEALEEMGINVLHARVSCNTTQFVMESIVEINRTYNNNDAQAQEIDEIVLMEAILKSIRRSSTSN